MSQIFRIYLLVSLCFVSISFAQDMNQLLPFQQPDGSVDLEKKGDLQYEEGNSPFLTFDEDKNFKETKSKEYGDTSPFIGTPKDIKPKENENFLGLTNSGSQEKSGGYLEYDNKQILKDYRYKSKDRINVALYFDSFDYKNASDNFDRTYRDSQKVDIYGSVYFSYDKYLTKNILSITYGAGAGVGYNGGKGIFEGESLEVSDSYDDLANFSLWTIPLDLRIGVEVLLSHYLAVSVSGGPSLMGLIQNRSDQAEGEARKTRRQMSPGYFAIAAFKVNLGEMANDLGFEVLSKDQVNRFYMNLEARTQGYSSFKSEDVSIEGTSFGLGFTYDFI